MCARSAQRRSCSRQRQHHDYKLDVARLSVWLLCVARTLRRPDVAATLDNERQWHLVIAEDEAAARAFIEGDPFRKAGVYEYRLDEVKKLRGEL